MGRGAVYAIAIALLVVCGAPFLWMAVSSLKTVQELYAIPPTWFPSSPTLGSFEKVLFHSNIPRYFYNTFMISIGSTAIALFLASLASYGFARYRFRGRVFLQAFVLAGQLLPLAAIVVPLFVMVSKLGLANTYTVLVVTYLLLTLPLSIWMLTSYFRTIPEEIEESAIIDGLSRLGVLYRITVPLSLPGMVAIAVYCFVTTWNEYVFALVFGTDTRVKTLAIGLTDFMQEFDTDWSAVMASALIMTIPVAGLFLLLQRLFVSGLTASAVKA